VTTGHQELAERRGPRPRTTPTSPHTQLDQQPAAKTAGRLRDRLARALFELPGVREAPSAVSVPGARALWLAPSSARGPRDAFLVGSEFAHLHPAPDWSLHAALPPRLAEEAVARGWAEAHPAARLGLVPPNVVMLYAPRDEDELRVILDLVRAGHAYARGETAGAHDRARDEGEWRS
jgi:hypothetical protein